MLQHNLAQKGLPGAAAILLQGCFVPSCGAEYILSRAGGILMKISWGGGEFSAPLPRVPQKILSALESQLSSFL